MIQIKPVIPEKISCECGGDFIFSKLLWQGLHTCEKFTCNSCQKIRINSLPVNQAAIEQYSFYPDAGLIFDNNGNVVQGNWYSSKLKSITSPSNEIVNLEIEVIRNYNEVVILNTLDYIYGHSFLFLLNLQRIIQNEKKRGIIVIVQPMIKWLIPKNSIAEIWTVKLGFQKFNKFYPDLSSKLNSELFRFQKVWLSKGHILPTNDNIEIEAFTGIKPYGFLNAPIRPRVTFIWREDPDRLWIRNIYLLKGFKKLGMSKILLPFQYLRVILLFKLLKRKLGREFLFTVAGFGTSLKLPSFIDDQRVSLFNEVSEKGLCKVYAESTLVIGVHGSGMLLPSAHAGMAISLMPSKRWGNFAEDILFTESDVRLAEFQRRVIPLNLCISDISDIVADMISGRECFIKKFIHDEEL